MKVSFASERGSGEVNEDWVGATQSIAVVLDGITTPPGMGDVGCVHGTPWLVASIGSSVLLHAEQQPEVSLIESLRQAITDTAARHADTCDLNAPGTPSAGVAMIRTTDRTLDYLVLSDAFVVIDTGDDVQAITDLRGQEVVADLRSATFAHPIGSEAHATNRRAMVELQRSYRNAANGYWVAAGHPAAADHAITGQISLTDVRRAAVLSDGAAALVEYGQADWKDLLGALEHGGPSSVVRDVREAERSDPDGVRWPRFKTSDDATVVFRSFHGPDKAP
jgi:hypothetical protein